MNGVGAAVKDRGSIYIDIAKERGARDIDTEDRTGNTWWKQGVDSVERHVLD